MSLPWEKAFDFCERLYSHLAQDVYDFDSRIPRAVVQEHIERELQTLFYEEHLAFEFSEGIVRRRGRRNTADKIARAEVVLGDPKLSEALKHFNKALGFFRSIPNPDDENTTKEAVCAVEAAAKALFPDKGTTLGEIINAISGNSIGEIPKSIAKTFHGLYGFSSAGEGVRHGGGDGGPVTREIAEYTLAVSASQIVFLYDLSKALELYIPF